MSKIGVIAVLTAKEGHADALGQALVDGSKKVRADEPGCLVYTVTRSRQDPNTFKVLEVYASQADLDAHPHTPHFQVIRAALQEHMGAPPQVEYLDVTE